MNILLLLAVIIAVFFGFQYLMVFRMKLKKGKAAPELSGKYATALKNNKTSLFYFYSPSCGACRSMTPLVTEYSKNSTRCFPVDISQDMDTARAFGVMGTPSTVLVENGNIKDFIVGPRAGSELSQLLEQTRD
jgi:thioredoxin 1